MSSSPPNLRKPAFLSIVPGDGATLARFASVGSKDRGAVDRAPAPPPAPAPQVRPEADAARALERVEMALSLLRAQGERLAEQARADALELAFLVARRILEHEVSIDPGALMSLIRSAIAKAGDANRVVLRLCPKDLDTVKATQSKDPGALSMAKIELVPDASLEHGDCLVETDLGTVDGRLATRLSEMRDAIGTALGGTGT